ncbi:hypothetical protein DXG01_016922 [Tephrocybe rancida]|nr:hypothetical protein DXG01_016922 [Tephrocybe rancida]
MVNPGVFHGSCKVWLLEEVKTYRCTYQESHGKDTIHDIQWRYFKHYDPKLPLDKEPTAQVLALVDNSAAEPDRPPLPDALIIGLEVYTTAKKQEDFHTGHVTKLQGQISGFLTYQHGKVSEMTSAESGSFDPFSAFYGKFLGITRKQPRCKAAYNVWRRSNPKLAAKVYEKQTQGQTVEQKDILQLQDKAANDIFRALTGAEILEWVARAKQEHSEELLKWRALMSSTLPTDPLLRQRAIECISKFVMPILDLLKDVTGWKWLLQGGGPEPANAGRLNVTNLSSSTMSGDVGLTFVQAQCKGYKKHMLPIWSNDLTMSYKDTTLLIANLGLDGGNTLIGRARPSSGDSSACPAAAQRPSLPLSLPQVLLPTLPATGHPPCISDWIKHARSKTYLLSSKVQATTLEKDFGACLTGGNAFGKNGFLSTLAALFFWLHLVTTQHIGQKAWDTAVEEVTAVLVA